ncbi:hypothetical protein [Rhodopirellula europaea]|uniref:hypothetical protein n=1 Tax=Rhodopirellula europaea TaxID=1263866 RepID=UPI003D2707F7
MKRNKKQIKSLDIPSRPDRDRRVRQADRIARVLKVLALIQSGKNYNVKAMASEIGCSIRTIARDLETLTLAGVPWFFDQASSSYRLPPHYRFPIRLGADLFPQSDNDESMPHGKVTHYDNLFIDDEPLTRLEVQFMARWLHESHHAGELRQEQLWAMRGFADLSIPSVGLANFYNAFMIPFRPRPRDFVCMIWEADVIFVKIPWKTPQIFQDRNDAICQWLKQNDPDAMVDIQPIVNKYRETK